MAKPKRKLIVGQKSDKAQLMTVFINRRKTHASSVLTGGLNPDEFH